MDQPEPTTFPGCIYDVQGRRLDRFGPDMTQEQLNDHQHQTLVANGEGAEVASVWLLADDATPAAIPPAILTAAIQLVLSGQALLIAAREPQAELDVREALLQALEQAAGPA